MGKTKTRRQRAIIRRRIFLSSCAVVLVTVIALVVFAVNAITKSITANPSDNGGKPKPVVIPDTYATVISTGDVMVHSPQLTGAYVSSTGEYDFSPYYKEVAPYLKAADLAVANLEVTFGSTQSGKYSGYPAFNCPDSLADALKNAGFNLLLTSNNHSYDTGLFGLKRTVQVLKEKGIEHTGTRELEDEPKYIVKTINDINIGIANFTYETDGPAIDRKYLNGAIISKEANGLINSFSYKRIEEFYAEAQAIIEGMKEQKADYIVFYVHWGDEYKTVANTWQKTIAQRLSNLGVNMIIGSHPHVIEPIELIYPEGRDDTTVCLYSTGNSVSNQRQELMDSCPSGHTEDGMLFSFTLKKGKDGVSLNKLDLIPTWVNKYRVDGKNLYTVYPLETAEDGSQKYSLDSVAATKASKSYERTKAIVAAGLTQCQEEIGCEITFK